MSLIEARQARWVQLGNVPVGLRYGRLGELMLGVFGCVSVSPVEASHGRQGGVNYVSFWQVVAGELGFGLLGYAGVRQVCFVEEW